MKQRLGIAAALLGEPELLILDEPTNGTRRASARSVASCALADDGMTVLVSSHLLSEIEAICDDVVMVAEGRLLFGGSVGELLDAQHATVRVRPEHALDTERLAALVRDSGLAATVLPDGELEVEAPPAWTPELNRLAFAEGITLGVLRAEHPSLEEAFFQMTDVQ